MIQRISLYGLFFILSGMVYAVGQIDIAYTPYTISTPGSYIVVKDLTTSQNYDCIDIATSNVTIDLNGHTLYGGGTSSGSNGSGIYDLGGTAINNNIIVKNGNIRDFRMDGVLLNGNNSEVSKLNVTNCGSYGININYGIVENNNVSYCCAQNAVYQITCGYGSILNNRVRFSGLGGGIGYSSGIIKDNYCVQNALAGIECDEISKVIGNYMYGNLQDGILLDNAQCQVEDNICISNHQNGINAYIGGCFISKNVCQTNSYCGITTGDECDIRDNMVYENSVAGIICQTDCQVVGNSVSYHITGLGYGISVNGAGTRVDNNHITSNNYGIYFTSASNWYGRNTFSFNLHITGGTAPADPGSPYTNQSF